MEKSEGIVGSYNNRINEIWSWTTKNIEITNNHFIKSIDFVVFDMFSQSSQDYALRVFRQIYISLSSNAIKFGKRFYGVVLEIQPAWTLALLWDEIKLVVSLHKIFFVSDYSFIFYFLAAGVSCVSLSCKSLIFINCLEVSKIFNF